VRACFTTRRGPGSGPYAGFNLADHVGDEPQAVARNRALLRQRLELPHEPVWLRQVHGTRVVDAARCPPAPEADASHCHGPGGVCAVLTADCLPLLLCDRAGTRVAAAHAGWRGLARGVIEATVDVLGSPGQDTLAYLGPAIGPAAFEVGPEVRDVFLDHSPLADAAFAPSPGGRWLADLYALARLRLLARGVCAVYGGELCTLSDPDRFYSYRREPVTGRMASLIWIAPDPAP
jgi:hypothetical protein